MNLFGSMEVKENELYIAGINTKDLVKEHGTPLYVIDENLIRENCRRYTSAFKTENGNRVAYAGKAFLTIAMCEIVNEEGMNLDVVSGGELYTAHKSGFPMERIYFHGNNKSYEEISMGINLGVGRFVVDNLAELEMISNIATDLGKTQDILLRVTPGIEAHTHEYIKTGQIDSKFGFSILEDNLFKVIDKVKNIKGVNLLGLHCHIGSQIFDTRPYEEAVHTMLGLLRNVKDKLGIILRELNLGGGFGIYYTKEDDPKTIEEFCTIILNKAQESCKSFNLEIPILTIEPGRSIVGNAGTTLYTVGAIKEIPKVRKYVAIDGGMTDNIRPSLYNAEYECVLANKVEDEVEEKVTIAGKCCESGDILISDVNIPKVHPGDIVAMLSTGAYCYSMSSNYNKARRSAVILVKEGMSKVICKRETYEDIIRNELSLKKTT